MKALVLETPGEEPKLSVKEIETPQVGPLDVLVRVKACGFCYHDVAVMRGVLRRGVKPQIILGHEISGEVADVGELVTAVSKGDKVVSLLTESCGQCIRCRTGREYRCLYGKGVGHAVDGGFAEFVKLRENGMALLPDGIDLQEACLFACPMGVALQAARDVARLQPGETAVVTGAGGGLGVHAVQVTKALGARVLAVTTSPEKIDRIQELGVEEVILAGELDFSEMVMALTEDQGADVVIDTVGFALFSSSFRSLSQYGRMVIIGEVAGGKVSINPAEVMFKDASVSGSTGAGLRHLLEVAAMVQQGRLKPVVSQTFPLEEAITAYRLMREKQTFGRVALVP
ncbi:MAG: zinc-binding dehydrogenase [Chloroflexi bacterium]|nr:zinc-binding dehydrogenase [Chloroflexota bacterium]